VYQRDQQSEKRVSLVFLLYQKGRDSRIFQTQGRAIEDFTLKAFLFARILIFDRHFDVLRHDGVKI
jgi:hypothetical protein